MNKTSYVFIAIGVLIIVGLVYFMQPKKSTNSSTNTNSNQNVVEEVPVIPEIVIDYHKDLPFEPQAHRVEEGQKVLLKISSDVKDTVHVHGFHELNKPIEANQQVTIEFEGKKTGRFEFVLEDINKTLGYLEVYPK